jgi:hypothetical protein
MLSMRFSAQGYHHIENLSTAVSASSFLIRLIPFYHWQFSFHDGFDQFERIFTSIPDLLAISPYSLCELGPEHFLLPEMFCNINAVLLPSGFPLPMTFPKWAPDSHAFVEFHRYALESSPIRSRLNTWIDLVFGHKQVGADATQAMNLFNPMGYQNAIRPPDRSRRDWTRACGQLPEQLFVDPFPESRHTAEDVSVVLTPTRPALAPAFHASHFVRDGIKSTVVNVRQHIGATIADREVLLWSVASGALLAVLEVEGVRYIVFDEDMNVVYLATAHVLQQFSLSGSKMREMDFGADEITALSLFGMGFTFDHRLVLVGLGDGSVRVVASVFQGRQLMEMQSTALSAFPIAGFVLNRASSVVEAFDSTAD